MQCPMTKFDCISCEGKCLLEERKRHADPFRRDRELRTDDDELSALGMLTEISSRAGKPPCGECHLQAGETCDICGAKAA